MSSKFDRDLDEIFDPAIKPEGMTYYKASYPRTSEKHRDKHRNRGKDKKQLNLPPLDLVSKPKIRAFDTHSFFVLQNKYNGLFINPEYNSAGVITRTEEEELSYVKKYWLETTTEKDIYALKERYPALPITVCRVTVKHFVEQLR